LALSIKDAETERLARTLAERTGETLTVATRRALEERLRRIGGAALLKDLAAIRRRWSKMPLLDPRSADEIIGYDENGLPADGDRHLGDCCHRVQRTRGRELRTPHRRCIDSPDLGRDRAEAAMGIETRLGRGSA